MKFLKGLLVILLILLLGFLAYAFLYSPNYNYVTIDINPSVELVLNSKDEVVDVIALNEDANILLVDLDLKGLTLEEATTILLDYSMEIGYIDELGDENTILITSYCDDEEERVRLENLVVSKFESYFEKKDIYPLLVVDGLSDELKEEAELLEISNGKMLLIERALLLDTTLTKTDLVDLTIKEIQEKIADSSRRVYEAIGTSKTEINNELREQKANMIEEKQTLQNQFKEQLYEESGLHYEGITSGEKNAIIETLVDDLKMEIKNKVEEFANELIDESGNSSIDEKTYPVINNGDYQQIKTQLSEKMGKN